MAPEVHNRRWFEKYRGRPSAQGMTFVFDGKAPVIMAQLMKEFGFSPLQAAGILGAIGHESSGFATLQNGYGWLQWAGSRREMFHSWCDRHRLPPEGDEGNYGYLVHELQHEYASAVSAVLKTNTLKDAVRAFERNFERAGEPNYANREKWAARAMRAYQAAGMNPPVSALAVVT